jgi:hypothetical protein
MTEKTQKPPRSGQLKIHMPRDLEPIYANLAVITNSFSEIVMDLAQILPGTPQAQVKARVIMTPSNAKALSRALQGHIKKFEQKFGEIHLPDKPTLADELFRSLSSPQEPEEE